ncbi:MAG TPA: helix-turn-helix transcriptional regulator [Streptosporangiaceae bacterium]
MVAQATSQVAAPDYAQAAPAAPLRGLIAAYQGYQHEGLPPGQHRGMPSPYLTLVITLHEPLVVARHPDPGTSPGEYLTLAGGLHTTPVLISYDERMSGIQLAISPLAARSLFGLPAGELASLDVEATEVLGATAIELHERIRAADEWPARFEVLDQLLLASADPDAPVHPGVARAWQLILASGGTVRVGELAAETGWSARHLQALFQAETGLTPKAACRVTRFHRARRTIQRRVSAGALPDLADVAARCGYVDQAHLAREFRELAGCPPSQWLAEEFRIIQGSGPGGEPDLRT